MKLKSMRYEKIIAGFVSIAILAMLVLSGPAQAFVLKLAADKTTAGKSEKIVFNAGLDINSGENLPVKNLTLIISGTETRTCVFDITGKAISGCFNINIKKINIDSEYGYGYGYNHGYGYSFGYGYGITGSRNLTYEITIHSQHFLSGSYTTKLEARIGDKKFSANGPEITINSELKKKETKEYNGTEQEIEFNETKTKFKIKTNNNASGNVYVSEYSELPENVSGFSIPSLKFMSIEADDSISNEMNESEIRVYYSDAEVSSAGINEDSLRLYYYNSTNNSWEKYDGVNGGVNTTGNYVWAITNHFSIWGVFGNAVTNNNGNNNGGGGSSRDDDVKKLPDETLTIAPKDNGQNSKPEEVIKLNEKKNIEQKTNQRAGAGITGGVIGTMASGGGILILVFLIGIVGMGIAITLVRSRRRKQMKHGDITLGSNTEVLKGY